MTDDTGPEGLGAGRFELRRRLGAGGMGVVYEAFDRERGQLVALKTLRDLEPRGLLRFKQEFRAIADLAHPNLVQLGELFEQEGRWFFTMELLDGQDFVSWVRGERPAPPSVGLIPPSSGQRRQAGLASTHVGFEPAGEAEVGVGTPTDSLRRGGGEAPVVIDEARLRAALPQLAAGLGALHAAGKVHRDIKPSNVLVTPAGRVVVLDFGLVMDTEDDGETESAVVGTALYMAPEQAASKRVGPEADWYAVGVMLYEALVGAPPFSGPALKVLMDKQREEPAPPSARVAGVAEDLDRLCAELLRVDPARRPTGSAIAAWVGAVAAGTGSPLPSAPSSSPTQTAPFVGRAAELAALAEAWKTARAVESRAVTVFVVGESGIGKSALVRRFLAELELEEPPPLLLTSRCYEREAVPFKAFDGLVDALSRHLSRLDALEAGGYLPHDASLLARLFPVLRRVPAMSKVAEVRVQSPQELRTRAFSALRELLTRMAERRPVALYIDDLQWADADSLTLLAHLMQGAFAPPLLLVATLRPSGLEAVHRLGALSGDTRHLELGGLGADEARGLVELLGGGSAEAGAALVAEGGGHPLFLQELVRHAQEAGTRGPVRLEDAVWGRVLRLEAPARRVLEVIAVAGEPLALPLVAEATRLPAAETSGWIALLRAAQLVRGSGGRGGAAVECYHDRVREAVAARVAPSEARALHTALAAALEAGGAATADPLRLVRHLEAAGETVRAAAQAERAAHHAADVLAFDRAAELYRTALRLGRHDVEARRKLQIAVGDALVAAGRASAAAEAYLVAAEGADAATRLECRRKAAEHLLITGEIRRGLDVLADVLAEYGDRMAPTPARALASLLLSRARLRLRGLRFKRRDASEIPARELVHIDVYRSVGVGLGLVDSVRAQDFQARALLRALSAGEVSRLVRSIGLESVFIGTQGGRKLARARAMAELARDLAATTDDPAMHAWGLGANGIVSYLSGELVRATRELGASEVMFRDESLGNQWEITTARIVQALARRSAGLIVDLKAGYDANVEESTRRGDLYAAATLIRVSGQIWLAADQPARALEDLARVEWHPPPGAYHMQNAYEWRTRAEVALYLGEPGPILEGIEQTTRAIEKAMLMRIQSLRTEHLWFHGRLALAVAEHAPPGEVPALVARARAMARKLRAEERPNARAWAALLEAGVAYRSGQPEAALEHLRAAAPACEAAELLLAAATARLVRGLILGGDGGEDLTQEALGAFAREGVRRPEAFVRVIAPGFDIG